VTSFKLLLIDFNHFLRLRSPLGRSFFARPKNEPKKAARIAFIQ
jgi:hypothetical protein